MFECGDRLARETPLYSETVALRLSRGARRLAAAFAVLGTLAAAGCSTFQLESLGPKLGGEVETTGSIGRMGAAHPDRAAAAQLSEGDLVYARAAAADVLAHGGKDNSVPWRNPQTGTGGNITPLPATYEESGLPCRDFLASYGREGAQSWLQGSACRTARGDWEVRSLKPLNSG